MPLHVSNPLSPVEIVTRSVASMKRFFSTTKGQATDEKPAKRARLQKRKENGETESVTPCLHAFGSIQERRESTTPLVDRSRRNGIVFDDITIWAQNTSPTTTVTKIQPSLFRLSDVDFSKPQPEWLTSAVMHTAQTIEFPDFEPPILNRDSYHVKSQPPAKIIDFLTVSEYTALRETTDISISALPPQPGYLQKTLFLHITSSLSAILNRAEAGLQDAWSTRTIQLPSHCTEAITYVISTLDFLAVILAAERVKPCHIAEIREGLSDIIRLVVQTASLIDGMDIRNLISDIFRRENCQKLGNALERVIAATIGFENDKTAALQSFLELLPASVPTMILPWRLHICRAIIESHIATAIEGIINESIISQSTLDGLDKYISIGKHIQKQLDRLALEGGLEIDNTVKRVLSNFDIQRTMFQAFLDGNSAPTPISAITFFDMAKTIAIQLGETKVQAESMYRIALLASAIPQHSDQSARELLLSASRLNSSEVFQRKVERLLAGIRRRTISSILDMAMLVHQHDSLPEFIEGVKIFVSSLLAQYPADGINGETVLDVDMVKGLLRVIRVFHPDKNASVDVEGRWKCEEVTKVYSPGCVN